MTDYVLTGLVRRRAAVTGEIEAIHTRLKGLLIDLESLDATILQLKSVAPRGGHPLPRHAAAEGLEHPGADEPDRAQHPPPSR